MSLFLLLPFRLSFYAFPVLKSFKLIDSLFVTEDMGMASQELFVDPPDDVIEVKSSRFFGYLAVEDDLEQNVAEFLPDLAVLTSVHGFH